MTDKMKSYLEAATRDKEHLEKLKTAKNTEEIAALAKEKGFDLSAEDLTPDTENRQLSEDELAAVAGGGVCGCYFVGAGMAGTKDEDCRCPVGGAGSYWDNDTQGVRCACVTIGYGVSYDK